MRTINTGGLSLPIGAPHCLTPEGELRTHASDQSVESPFRGVHFTETTRSSRASMDTTYTRSYGLIGFQRALHLQAMRRSFTTGRGGLSPNSFASLPTTASPSSSDSDRRARRIHVGW